MPTLPPTPSAVLNIVLHIDLNGDANVRTSLKWAYSGGPPSNSDCNTIAAAVGTAWHTNLGPLCTNTSALFLVEVIDLATVNGGVGQAAPNQNGTRAGTPLPIEVCALANHKIARKYRGGKPRSYFPYGVEADMNTDQRTWTGSFIAAFNTDYAAFRTAMNALTGGTTNLTGPVNVSYYKGYSAPTIVNNRAKNHLAPRATPVVDSIISTALNPLLASQRRRVGR